jgi:hypothetical protein
MDAGSCRTGLCVGNDGGILGSDGGTRPVLRFDAVCAQPLDVDPSFSLGAGAMFSAASFDSQPLPSSLSVDAQSGALHFVPQRAGHTSLILSGHGPLGADFVQIDIEAACEERALRASCGRAGAAPAAHALRVVDAMTRLLLLAPMTAKAS